MNMSGYNQQYVLSAGQLQQHQQQQLHAQTPQEALAAAAQLELAATNASAATALPPSAANAMAIRRPFDPTTHELDANFRLTRFADLKG